MCDRVLTLYRPCAYPGAVLRHASGPTGPRNSSRLFSPFINRRSRDRRNHGAPESKPNPASQKSTTLLWKWSFSYQKVFLAHFRGFVVWSVHVSKSSHPRVDRTLSVRRIVLSCFRPDESPKFGIVLRSSNRLSRDRRNHVVPESKPNPDSPQPTLKMKPYLAFLIKLFFFLHTFVVSNLNWLFSKLTQVQRRAKYCHLRHDPPWFEFLVIFDFFCTMV